VREFAARVHATELGLEEAVRLGLYVDEDKRTVELRFNAESADELPATVAAESEGFAVPSPLEAVIRAARAPLVVRDDFVLRRLRSTR